MIMAAGVCLVLSGLLLALVGLHMKSRRFFDRPSLARHRLFDPILTLLTWALASGGIVLIGRVSRAAAWLVVAVLAILWVYRRFIRSVGFQARLLRRDYDRLRLDRPALPESEILFELAYRRNPRWGEELIAQMVIDYPTFEDLAPMIAKMERGFRGFR